MTSWASVPRTRTPRADLPPAGATPRGVRSAALVVSGALLATSAATCLVPLLSAGPAQAMEPTIEVPEALASAPAATGRTVTFDYSAPVARNDVYDTDLARAPQPLFRTLGDRLDVTATYTGPPVRLGLAARLLSTTGWSTTVPLANEVPVDGRGRVRASLDLTRLEEKAARVAEQTAMPFEGLTIELVAVVRDADSTWSPSVPLALTSQQLRLVGDPTTLVVTQDATATAATAAAAAPTPQSRLQDALGWRPGGLLTSLVLTVAVAGAGVVARRRQDEDDVDRARRRLGRLLLEVQPVDLAGLSLVAVSSPDALARLAERYGLLVLHWADVDGPVFVVHDEAVAYCWTPDGRPARRGGSVSAAQDATAGGDPQAESLEQAQAAWLAHAREAARVEAERVEAVRRQLTEDRERQAEVLAQAQAQADQARADLDAARSREDACAEEAERAAQVWCDLDPTRAFPGAAPRWTVGHDPVVDAPVRFAVPAPRAAPERSATSSLEAGSLPDGPPRQAL